MATFYYEGCYYKVKFASGRQVLFHVREHRSSDGGFLGSVYDRETLKPSKKTMFIPHWTIEHMEQIPEDEVESLACEMDVVRKSARKAKVEEPAAD